MRLTRIEKKHNCRELLKEHQKKEEEKKKERKIIADEKRHAQNCSEMKKIKKKSLRYNNKRNITKDCVAYLA